MKFWHMLQYGWTVKTIILSEIRPPPPKKRTKTVYDSTYEVPRIDNSLRQKVEEWVPGSRGRKEWGTVV